MTYRAQDFVENLKDHILARLDRQARTGEGEDRHFTQAERDRLIICRNRMYKHKVMRVNYTTYDCRCDQDSLNPRTHADVMVLPHDQDLHEPRDTDDFQNYWYARVLGIFHVLVQRVSEGGETTEPQRVDLLWVRWFGKDGQWRSGWKARRLPRVGFFEHDDPEAFGFLDPDEVIRGVHLIPAFAEGKTDELLPGQSIARRACEDDEDWRYFYVNM